MIKGINPKFIDKLKRNAFNVWKSKVPDTDKQKRKLANMLNRYLLAPKPHRVLIKEPEQEIVDMMTGYHKLKNYKAKPISDFCKNLLNIKRQIGRMKRSLLLKKFISGLDAYILIKGRNTLSKWNRKAKLMETNEKAKEIQDYLRPKIQN